ncbi:MAG: [citrate (pro-3S)-lyase] ligase [Candidatus Phytoplasma cynodontis]|nr:MAG: [citrate (pro-3S)-lyase] ligase [Candidatus Phytoplasma cynodontis]
MNFLNFKPPKIISFNDNHFAESIDKLLSEENLKKDFIEEYAVILSNNEEIIGLIGRYANNLRCLVVNRKYRQYNIANVLVGFMSKRIYQKNFRDIFVFTKIINLDIFQNMGFKLIFQNNSFCFLTSRYDLFEDYLNYLSENKFKSTFDDDGKLNSVIVMNANPFTKGHKFIIQNAIKKSNFVYVIVVKEDVSLFTYQQRFTMVELGVKYLKNVRILEGSNYIISKNIFPSYFFKSQEESSVEQMYLDSYIFSDFIAPRLNVKKRFVGEEPFSKTTLLYNNVMNKVFLEKKIELVIIPRMLFQRKAISATQVRKLFIQGNFDKIKNLVPKSTFNFLKKLDYLKYRTDPDLLKLVDKGF